MISYNTGSKPGVLIWRYVAAVGARTTYSGVKDEISGAKACFPINKLIV